MHYSKFACSRHHWTFEERRELERRWNENLRLSKKSRLSTNAFADKYGIPRATLARETRRGTPGKPFYDNIRKEWFYYEYSAELAQEDANSKASGKGPRGNRVTNWVAGYMSDMLGRGFSVCTALKDLRDAGVAGCPARGPSTTIRRTGTSIFLPALFTDPGAGIRRPLSDIPPCAPAAGV